MMKQGSLVYAAVIKGYICIHAKGGLTHSLETTSANDNDLSQVDNLLNGKEEFVFADVGSFIKEWAAPSYCGSTFAVVIVPTHLTLTVCYGGIMWVTDPWKIFFTNSLDTLVFQSFSTYGITIMNIHPSSVGVQRTGDVVHVGKPLSRGLDDIGIELLCLTWKVNLESGVMEHRNRFLV